MKRPVLVTVSGMVGSGKSTAVRHILEVLRQEGIAAADWRFQRLPCINPRAIGRNAARKEAADGPDRTIRGQGYRARILTSSTALGYLARALAFRVYRRWPPTAPWAVSNRYFYDSLAHFDLSEGWGQFYARILRKLVPKPDLAFLMVAPAETLASRRPQYSAEYIIRLEAAYRVLHELFPELIVVNSDMGAQALESVEAAVRRRIAVDDGRRGATR